jgi:hypothetical protein
VPYATNLDAHAIGLYPETRAALEAEGIEAEYIDLTGKPTAYHELLLRTWEEGRGWINVEHDIVPWPGALRLLWDCSCDWGGYAYSLGNAYASYLGCTKFSDALVQAHPDAVRRIDGLKPDGTAPRYWGRLDTRLKQVLEDQLGLVMHLHWPAVGHMNPDKKPGYWHCRCGARIPTETIMSGPGPYLCPACQ